jgi:hypothetical protein
MMLKQTLLSVFVFISMVVSAQEDMVTNELPVELVQQKVPGEGNIVIHEEEGIDFLLDTHIEMNKRNIYTDGFRIQLFSGSGQKARHEAMDVKASVLELFPDEQVYLSFTAPFWRVRVGNYRNKYEALSLLNKLKKEFPNSYIVKDGSIKMEDLK